MTAQALNDGLLDLVNRPRWYYTRTTAGLAICASIAGALRIVADGGATVETVVASAGAAGLTTVVIAGTISLWASEAWRLERLRRLPIVQVSIEDTQPIRVREKTPDGVDPIPSKTGDWRAEARRHEARVNGPFRVVNTPAPTGPVVNPDVLRMWKLAHAYPRKMTLAEREWDDGHPFGGGEFRELLRYMTRERLIDWKHPTSKTQGRDFTRAGMAAMRFYQTRPTPPPWPDVPGSQIA